jgi:outer membrane protein TolC
VSSLLGGLALQSILSGAFSANDEDSTDAAQKYCDLAITRYRTGVDSYLDVLTAQTLLLTQQQTTSNLRVEQMTSNVQLIEALGGGWDNAQLPSEKAVAAK